MENPTLPLPARTLMAELEMQLDAYNCSLQNDEIVEVRKKIALRIVEIEKNLVSLAMIPNGYSPTRNGYRQLNNRLY